MEKKNKTNTQIYNSDTSLFKDIQVTAISKNEVKLMWSFKQMGNNIFSIFRDGDLIGNTSDYEFIDTHLNSNTTYIYKIFANDMNKDDYVVAVITTPKDFASDSGSNGDSANTNTKNGVIFYDDFESGDMKSTSSDGFEWQGTNQTYIVNNDGYILWDGNQSVHKGPYLDQFWQGHGNSKHAMRFLYKAGEFWSEQRYKIGNAYKEIWMSFALRVPINFKHNTDSPSNNKLLAIWMDDYSYKGDGSTVIWEFWSDGGGGSDLAVHYSTGRGTIGGVHKQEKPFISYPSDQGKWMSIIIHIKANSGIDTNDGVIEMYRKWDDENVFKQFHSLTDANLNLPRTGPQGFANGYMMGWSNPSYIMDTNFLMDDFTLSTKSLLP